MTDKEAEVMSTYEATKSIRSTARHCNLSEQKVRKILVSHGVDLNSPRTRKILGLYESGMSVNEISAAMRISPGAVSAHLPYTRGAYHNGTPTKVEDENQGE